MRNLEAEQIVLKFDIKARVKLYSSGIKREGERERERVSSVGSYWSARLFSSGNAIGNSLYAPESSTRRCQLDDYKVLQICRRETRRRRKILRSPKRPPRRRKFRCFVERSISLLPLSGLSDEWIYLFFFPRHNSHLQTLRAQTKSVRYT